MHLFNKCCCEPFAGWCAQPYMLQNTPWLQSTSFPGQTFSQQSFQFGQQAQAAQAAQTAQPVAQQFVPRMENLPSSRSRG